MNASPMPGRKVAGIWESTPTGQWNRVEIATGGGTPGLKAEDVAAGEGEGPPSTHTLPAAVVPTPLLLIGRGAPNETGGW